MFLFLLISRRHLSTTESSGLHQTHSSRNLIQNDKEYNFQISLIKSNVIIIYKIRLDEAILIYTNNICFYEELISLKAVKMSYYVVSCIVFMGTEKFM